MKNTFIYTLSCPITGDVRYVGKSNNPKGRYLKHCNEKLQTNKSRWINDLISNKLLPILSIIDEIPLDGWQKIEKFYISKYRNLGCYLLNTSIGGEGSDSGNKTSYKKGEGAKKIVALYLDGKYFKTFSSGVEARMFVGNSHISDVLSGKTKKCGGYIWIYENDYHLMTPEEIQIKVDNVKKINFTDNQKKKRFKKGESPWNKGIPMSEEYKQNWTQSLKKKNIKHFIKNSIPWNKGKN